MSSVLAVLLVLLAGTASAIDFPRQGFPADSGATPAPPIIITEPTDPAVIDSFTSSAQLPCIAPCVHGLSWEVTNGVDCDGTQTSGTDWNIEVPWAGTEFDGSAIVIADQGTTYTLVCEGPDGSDSAEVSVVTVPRDPTNLNCIAADTAFTCTWDHPYPQTVGTFTFGYRCPSGSGAYTTTEDATSPHAVSGRTNDTECDVYVRAFGPELSASLQVFETVTPSDTVAPGAPVNFTCSAGDTEATCTWLDATGDVDHYEFATCLDSDGCEIEGEWTIVDTATSPQNPTALTNDELYRARVRSSDEVDNFSAYATDFFTPVAAPVTAVGSQVEGNQTNATELARFVSLIGSGIYASRAATLEATAETAWPHTITAGAWESDTSSDACEPVGTDGAASLLQEAAADLWAMALHASIADDDTLRGEVRTRLLEFAATTTFDREDSGTLLSASNQCILDLSIAIHHLIEAALRLSGDGYASWTTADRVDFEAWLVDEVFTFTDWAAVTRKNNWGPLGLSAAAAIANYTDGSGRDLTRYNATTITAANYMIAVPTMATTLWSSTAGSELDSACQDAGQVFGFQSRGSWPDEMRRINDTTADCNAVSLISITAAGTSPVYVNKHPSGLVRLAELLRRDGSSTIFSRDQDSDSIPDLLESIRFNAGTASSSTEIGGSPTFTARTDMLSYLYVAGEFFVTPDVIQWADTNGSTRGGRDFAYGSITHAPGVAYIAPPPPSDGDATFVGPCNYTDADTSNLNDCYSMRVLGQGDVTVGDPLRDTEVRRVFDFDGKPGFDVANHASYVGDGPPEWGPVYDNSGGGQLGDLGGHGYILNHWSESPQSACVWPIGSSPGLPVGEVCNTGTVGCGHPHFVNAVAYFGVPAIPTAGGKGTCANVITDGGTSIDPNVTYFGGPSPNGTVIGNASYEAIQPIGVESPGPGIITGMNAMTDFASTLWVSYGNNHGNPEVLSGPAIKGDEPYGNGGPDLWLVGGYAQSSGIPFSKFPYTGGRLTTNCASAMANAVTHVGEWHCNGSAAVHWSGSSSPGSEAGYTRPPDFYDKMQCHRTRLSGLGTTNVTIKVWDGDVLIIYISNINGTLLRNQQINSYHVDMNYNVPTRFTEHLTRVYHQLHITANKDPVSCTPPGWPSS